MTLDVKFIGIGSYNSKAPFNLTSFYFDYAESLYIFECNTDTYRYLVNNSKDTLDKFSDIIIICTTPHSISTSGLHDLIQHLENNRFKGTLSVYVNTYYIKYFNSLMKWYIPYNQFDIKTTSVFEKMLFDIRIGFNFNIIPLNLDGHALIGVDYGSESSIYLSTPYISLDYPLNIPIQIIMQKDKTIPLISYTGANGLDIFAPFARNNLSKEFFDSEQLIFSVNKVSVKPSDVLFDDILRKLDKETLAKIKLVGLRTEVQYKEYLELLSKKLAPEH